MRTPGSMGGTDGDDMDAQDAKPPRKSKNRRLAAACIGGNHGESARIEDRPHRFGGVAQHAGGAGFLNTGMRSRWAPAIPRQAWRSGPRPTPQAGWAVPPDVCAESSLEAAGPWPPVRRARVAAEVLFRAAGPANLGQANRSSGCGNPNR